MDCIRNGLLGLNRFYQSHRIARTAPDGVSARDTSDADYVAAMKYMVGDPADAKMAGEILKTSRAPQASPIEYAAAQTAKLKDWWAPPGKAKYLILQGTHDQAAPPENGELLKLELGDRATLVQIPGAGHLMLISKPDIAGAVIVSFLKAIDRDGE